MYLSIILPYFKKKKYIKQTLNSIINQSFKKHELIIVYDQVDKSDIPYIKGILKNRIKYRIIENRYNLGAGLSRNIGIKKSKSKYIAFCDADDLWHKKKSETQLKIMKEKKLNFSHTNYDLINDRNKNIGHMNVKKDLSYDDLLKSCDIASSSVIIDRSILKRSLKFGNTKTKEDFSLWLKISKNNTIYGINKKLLNWRNVENSLSSNIIQKFVDAYIVFKNAENRNFIITIYYVIRLSVYYLIKKIKQKIS
tara:strand:- start:656 stop:1411 length:756 start_codon:yes stop_codon:yes gene_type:complete